MSLLQEYLRNGGTFEELNAKYAIDATRHKKYPNLVLLKYDQLNSPFTEAIVREARGIILDEADNWRIICRRFQKFSNYGEGYAAPINFETARATIKEDGSLATLYHYNDEWHISTSGSPDAGGSVGDFAFTFKDLFWRVFKQMGLRLPHDTNLCPSFELMTPWNAVVINHQEEKLVFIGLHNRETGEELPIETLDYYPHVRTFSFGSLDELLTITKNLNGSEQEGFVLTDMANKRDGDFCRVKIKSDDYVAKHHLKSSWSIRKAVDVVRRNEIEEVCIALPAFTEQLREIKAKYEDIVANLNKHYAELAEFKDAKEFALALQKRKPIGFHSLYALRRGHVKSVKEYMLDLHIDSLVDMLGLKTEDDNG